MRISTIKYTVEQGLRNIAKNKMFSIASVTTMVVCIFLFGVFYALIANAQGIMKDVEGSLPVVVFFDEDATQEEKDNIKVNLEQREDVSEVKYVSGEEGWENFKEAYFGQHEDLSTGFEENPLAKSDNFEVYMRDVEAQDEIVKFASELKGVRKVNASAKAAEMLKGFSILVATISTVVIALLLTVAIFLISNTVSMGITVRKEEIAIMKYIGAKDSFVRAPFILEGVLIGLVGAIIPLIMLYFGYNVGISYVMEKAPLLLGSIKFIPVGKLYLTLLPVGLALGVGIGFLGSHMTIRKHLKA